MTNPKPFPITHPFSRPPQTARIFQKCGYEIWFFRVNSSMIYYSPPDHEVDE